MIRNPAFNAYGTIDCEVEHPAYGWVPFTASPDDVEAHGRSIYEAALAMGPAEYVPPPVEETTEVIPSTISRFQARAALLDAGLLADVEIALADADPLTQLAWAEAVEWRRDSPTIAAIGSAIGLREEDIDNLFIEAAKIKA